MKLEALTPILLTVLAALLAGAAFVHVVLNKRDTKSAAGWAGLILFLPVGGAILYWLFGINRVRRKALLLPRRHFSGPRGVEVSGRLPISSHLKPHVRLVNRIARRKIVPGNSLEILEGKVAYESMLADISRAEKSIALCTYIFGNDPAGLRFIEALARAVERGVEVKVLIDDIGARYTFPPVFSELTKNKIETARFLPTRLPWHYHYGQLRNHRKILVVDGCIGHTGGMNIRQGHVEGKGGAIRDLNFRVEGPIVPHLLEVFAEDWYFCRKEKIRGNKWWPTVAQSGEIFCRALSDGPDEDFEKIKWTLLSAISTARKSIKIVTPYFLPDESLTTALCVAALKGISVEIYLPEKSNLTLVQWASQAGLWQFLRNNCRIFLVPPPFDHSKAVVIDSEWCMVGSANWDARSLRLNFEFNLECWSADFAGRIMEVFVEKRRIAKELTIEALEARPFLVRLRDSTVRLLNPYL